MVPHFKNLLGIGEPSARSILSVTRRVVARAVMACGILAVTVGASSLPQAEFSVEFPDAVLSQSQQNGIRLIRLDGIITNATARQLSDALRSLPRHVPVELELVSPGGFTSPGYRMIDLILAERQAGRTVATRVRSGEFCESMCVALYLAGNPRYAAPDAEFMVHAPRHAALPLSTLRSTRQMVDRLISLGASPDWVGSVHQAGGFSGTADYRIRAQELTAIQANVVTSISH